MSELTDQAPLFTAAEQRVRAHFFGQQQLDRAALARELMASREDDAHRAEAHDALDQVSVGEHVARPRKGRRLGHARAPSRGTLAREAELSTLEIESCRKQSSRLSETSDTSPSHDSLRE